MVNLFGILTNSFYFILGIYLWDTGVFPSCFKHMNAENKVEKLTKIEYNGEK
jgi:hypothetical protein